MPVCKQHAVLTESPLLCSWMHQPGKALQPARQKFSYDQLPRWLEIYKMLMASKAASTAGTSDHLGCHSYSHCTVHTIAKFSCMNEIMSCHNFTLFFAQHGFFHVGLQSAACATCVWIYAATAFFNLNFHVTSWEFSIPDGCWEWQSTWSVLGSPQSTAAVTPPMDIMLLFLHAQAMYWWTKKLIPEIIL